MKLHRKRKIGPFQTTRDYENQHQAEKVIERVLSATENWARENSLEFSTDYDWMEGETSAEVFIDGIKAYKVRFYANGETTRSGMGDPEGYVKVDWTSDSLRENDDLIRWIEDATKDILEG